METLSVIERIEIERACERLVYDYGRALDLGDMSAAADFFAEHGSMARPMAAGQVIQGSGDDSRVAAHAAQDVATKHLATNTSSMSKVAMPRAVCRILTMVATTPAADATPPHLSSGPVYFGEFKDRFVRENGVWKFAERRGSIQLKFSGSNG